MSLLDKLQELETQIRELRSLEEVRAQKLSAEQLADDRAVMLANALALLRRLPLVNGTVADDIRRQRDAIERHLRKSVA
jgi:hypothetical protein